MVYVIAMDGKPLMPTERHGKVRRMLREGRAKVVRAAPFTIRLQYETSSYVQPATLGLDAGYGNIGFSAVNATRELISGEVMMLEGMSERLKRRAMYRRQRRSRLRYRKNRGKEEHKPKGWLAPSLQHKSDTHERIKESIGSMVPLKGVILEVASFDIQKLKDPDVSGADYQHGERCGFENLREYILHRDHHRCRNPECTNRSEQKILQVHHIGYWKEDRSDRPGNLITLCTKCHTPANHKKKRMLYGWEPKLSPFRAETFMSAVRWKLTEALGAEHTYGYVTKAVRKELGLAKSHLNDAFVIAGGRGQKRCDPFLVRQRRRNNRSLDKFYDARHLDARTGKKASGQELSCGRRVRNRQSEKNGPDLRIFRGKKLSCGRRSIRRRRYPFQPGDQVWWKGGRYTVQGTHNLGTRAILSENKKSVATDRLKLIRYRRGLCFELDRDGGRIPPPPMP